MRPCGAAGATAWPPVPAAAPQLPGLLRKPCGRHLPDGGPRARRAPSPFASASSALPTDDAPAAISAAAGLAWPRPLPADAQCEGRWASWVLVLSRAAPVLSWATRSAISSMRLSSCSSFRVSRHARMIAQAVADTGADLTVEGAVRHGPDRLAEGDDDLVEVPSGPSLNGALSRRRGSAAPRGPVSLSSGVVETGKMPGASFRPAGAAASWS